MTSAHHVDERFGPSLHLHSLLGREIEWSDDILLDFVDVASVGADKILDLPHIKDVFGDVFFSFLRCYIHDAFDFYLVNPLSSEVSLLAKTQCKVTKRNLTVQQSEELISAPS